MAFNNEIEVKDAIKELKQRLNNDMSPEMLEDENFFHRFLKAKDFDVDLTETTLRKHLEWRKKHDVDNIMEFKQPEIILKYGPLNFLGYDKEGCPVRYISAGNIDTIGIILSVKEEDIKKQLVYELESDLQRMKIQSKKLGKTVNKCVYIVNLENLSFATATDKNVILHVISNLEMYRNNYPNMMKAAYFINANYYFNFLFAVIKRILPASLMKKIIVCSDDTWKEKLLEIMDDDILPPFLGGTRKDLDNLVFIKEKKFIPETCYIRKSKRALASCPDVQKVTLPRAAFHEVLLEVKEQDVYVEWTFETKCRDVGFGLFLRRIVDGEEENVELIPLRRIDTEEFAETGLYLCEEEGTYVIVFDNTYSWVRAKEIFYRVKIMEPTKEEL